jgi:hypothetical protein
MKLGRQAENANSTFERRFIQHVERSNTQSINTEYQLGPKENRRLLSGAQLTAQKWP